jgi:hypothetical protein
VRKVAPPWRSWGHLQGPAALALAVTTCIGVTDVYSQEHVRTADQRNLRSELRRTTDASSSTPRLEVIFRVTTYELDCATGERDGCVAKPKVMMEPKDVAELKRVSGAYKMSISVCPKPYDGTACSVAKDWDVSQTETDLRGQVTRPCQYVLGWKLGGAAFKAHSNPLTFTGAGIVSCSR